MKRIVFFVLNTAVPLLVGLVLYVAFRQETYLSVLFCDLFSVSLPEITTDGAICKMVKWYLPDMLWAYSLSSALSCVVGTSMRSMIIVFTLSAIFCSSIELMQKAGAISGTFDIRDIILEIIATIISLIIIYILFRRKV